MKMQSKRIMAAALAAVMVSTAGGGAFDAYGAAAGVDVDETMYVNLDYYGKTSKVNVVKTLNPNGNTEYTDYGNYNQVVNMSGDETPVMGDGSVQWTLPEGTKRFYYKGSLDNDQVVLPWNFDVSYKLNGVPTDADKLAGASGLIEIHVVATPNEKAKLYYRNNLMLIVAFPVDMSKCYSVEADGSQTQTLGETTAVVFTALPGEDGDYTVRIGTDSFETTGVIMTMAPGTLEDLEHIKDLKEDKDTWRNAGNELYDSLEQMARSVENMRQGVNQVQAGMNSADSAREKWSANKDNILAGNDQILASLTAVSKQMETIVPHLQTAKDAAETVHSSLGDIVNTLGEMQDPLRRLETRLDNIKSETEGIEGLLPDIQTDLSIIVASDAILQEQVKAIVPILEELGASLTLAEDGYDSFDGTDVFDSETAAEIDGAQSKAENAPENRVEDAADANASGAAGSAEDTSDATGSADESASDVSDEQNADESAADANTTGETLGKAAKSRKDAPLVTASASALSFDSISLIDYLGKIAKDSQELTTVSANLMDNLSDSAGFMQELTEYLDYLIEDTTALHDSLDTYYPDLQQALDDSKELVNRTTEALNNGISTMTIVQNTLKDSSNDLDAAARDSLRGSLELLDKSLSILDSTTAMREAGKTMKDVMDKELDKFEDENRFLYIDPTAEKESLTSDKNQAPKTLQIVLRTDEISLEDEDKTLDAEVSKETISPLKRMWNVLVKMWNAIVSIFKER